MNDCIIKPEWPAPLNVHACTTLRFHGNSEAPFNSWNLASHVQDNEFAVEQNRQLLNQRLDLPSEPIWLEQVHGIEVVTIDKTSSVPQKADGSFTTHDNKVCCVMTADCLPVLMTNREGTEVAAVHAGWRGLADGVVEAALKKFTSAREELLVWLGPAIGPEAFEVGEEVRDVFLRYDPDAKKAFVTSQNGTLLANIYLLAQQRLHMAGVTGIFGGDYCTNTEDDKFFSYRRHAITGRMASLIWMQS